MLDIETLGTKPGCIVREIGIIEFNETDIIWKYQYDIDIKSQEEKGLITEWKTAQWVLENTPNKPRYEILTQLCENYPGVSLYNTTNVGQFTNVNNIYGSHKTLVGLIKKDTEIWVNGTTFDIPILEHFFKTFGLESPFKYYYNIRDFRTIKKFFNFDDKSIPAEPFPHLAVSDCFWQVKALQTIYKQHNIN